MASLEWKAPDVEESSDSKMTIHDGVDGWMGFSIFLMGMIAGYVIEHLL